MTISAASQIRDAVTRVAELRAAQLADPARLAALKAVKHLQAQRFRGSHADLLADARHGPASRFFLEELYSDKDYSQRDAQFNRIAGALQKFFPVQVVETAVAMSALHRLTEELDDAMAHAWSALEPASPPARRYTVAWRQVGQRSPREQQLTMVLRLGSDLDRLTRTPGLRMALRLMRKPAAAAGLGALQGFLERGFDTFAAMRGAGDFLDAIRTRESQWIARLFDADTVTCETALQQALDCA